MASAELQRYLKEDSWLGTAPPGWMPMVERLCDFIDMYATDWRIEQMKEKFGGLRFYVHIETSGNPQAIYGAIHFAESMSLAIDPETGEFRGN